MLETGFFAVDFEEVLVDVSFELLGVVVFLEAGKEGFPEPVVGVAVVKKESDHFTFVVGFEGLDVFWGMGDFDICCAENEKGEEKYESFHKF